jgi:hypothetical protein
MEEAAYHEKYVTTWNIHDVIIQKALIFTAPETSDFMR